MAAGNEEALKELIHLFGHYAEQFLQELKLRTQWEQEAKAQAAKRVVKRGVRKRNIDEERQKALDLMLARLKTAEDGLGMADLKKILIAAGLKVEARAIITPQASSLLLGIQAGSIIKARISPHPAWKDKWNHRYFDRANYLRWHAGLPDDLQRQLLDTALLSKDTTNLEE